jgi:hypothetical protein
MAGFYGDAGAEPESGARGESYGFKAEDVVAEVFPGMSDGGQARAKVQQFHSKHTSMVADAASVRGHREAPRWRITAGTPNGGWQFCQLNASVEPDSLLQRCLER